MTYVLARADACLHHRDAQMASVLDFQDAARVPNRTPPPPESWRSDIVACSDAMQALLAQARRAAACDAPVCLSGPAGSGKRALARAIHRASARAAAPFCVVSCADGGAALESQIFGPEAASRVCGGTLYLDAVHALAPAVQARLARALEAAAPPGFAAGARLVSGTTEPLEGRVAAGTFRADLYQRLACIRLAVPPLAERREDIPLLVAHALARCAPREDGARPTIAQDALDLLVAAPWPGNVRELLNLVERLAASAPAGLLTRAKVGEALGGAPLFVPLDAARRAFERDYLVRVLKIACGSVSRAARLAGRNRTEFYRLLARHGLVPAAFRRAAQPAAEARAPEPRD